MNTELPALSEHTQAFSLAVKQALLTHPQFTTVTDLARALGRHRNSVSRAIHQNCFPRVRKQIARKLNIPLE